MVHFDLIEAEKTTSRVIAKNNDSGNASFWVINNKTGLNEFITPAIWSIEFNAIPSQRLQNVVSAHIVDKTK